MSVLSPATPSSAVPPGPTFSWKPALLALGAVLLVLIGLYYETAAAMVTIWARSDTFAHAFLVPPITLWLIWEKRRLLARQQPHPSLWVALPLAALAFGWLLGDMAAVNSVTQLAFTGMLILAVPLVIGWPTARLITFPLGFLLFAVPIGEFVMPMLMDWTAAVTVIGLRATGIPVYQEGLQFVIPSGRWSVVEACSGVRYLIASITVGTLFAYLNYRSLKRRLIFVGVSILVPVVANWIRAYMIVMLGHLSGGAIATGVDHLIYGWVFFGIVIMIMFAIGMRWQEAEVDEDVVAALPGVGKSEAGSRSLAIASLVFAAVVALPHGVLWLLESGSPIPPPQLNARALSTGGWHVDNRREVTWAPVFNNPSADINVLLGSDKHQVGVYIAYYRQQNYTRKLISSDNVLARSDDKTWAQVERGTHSVTLADQSLTLRTARLRGRVSASSGSIEKRLVAWHWYWINGRLTANDYAGKVMLALSKLMGQGDDSAAVVIYAAEDQTGGAEAALESFVTSNGLDALLAQAKRQR